MEKKRLLAFMVGLALLFCFAQSSNAGIDFQLLGSPVRLMGYIQQGVQFGIVSDAFDTRQGFQSALTQGLLEIGYEPSQNFKFFGSLNLNMDLGYPILNNNNEWNDKGLKSSRDRLFIFGDYDDWIKEAHVTWTQGDFSLRVGKQIVKWGETDGFRLMDQINPIDQRRGFGDVQFENSILPLWMVRADYRLPIKPFSIINETALQLVFNPNLVYPHYHLIIPGADLYGIWAPFLQVGLGGPYPNDYAYFGSFIENLKKPDGTCDPKGMEIGIRLRSMLSDGSIVTLNYFYGRDEAPARRALPIPPVFITNKWDGRSVMHLYTEAFFPINRYVGATWSKDLDFLKASALGGVSPVVRLEALYAFDNTFGTEGLGPLFVKTDEFRCALGVDWKIKIPVLNPMAYFYISPSIYLRRIQDQNAVYFGGTRYHLVNNASGDPLETNNWVATIFVNTTYFHNKIQPMFFYMRDITLNAYMAKAQVAYEHSDKWKFTLGVLFTGGHKTGESLQVMDHKDNVYFTATYKF